MNKKRGFTLIELLTVVLIIGILTAIALPQYRKSIQRAETVDAIINLKTIFDGAKRKYMTSSAWPESMDGLDVELFDIDENGNMGEFQYTFAHSGSCGTSGACSIKACRRAGSSRSAANTYCLTAYYSLNGTNWTKDIETASSSSIYQGQGLALGLEVYNKGSNSYWKGSIDLTESYIKINGSVWWIGSTIIYIL